MSTLGFKASLARVDVLPSDVVVTRPCLNCSGAGCEDCVSGEVVLVPGKMPLAMATLTAEQILSDPKKYPAPVEVKIFMREQTRDEGIREGLFAVYRRTA